jgi:hypothetical protein
VFFFFISLHSIPSVSWTLSVHLFCPHTLPPSFPLSLSVYSSCTLLSLSILAFRSPFLAPSLKYFSCIFSISSCSFYPQISAPYINILSIMVSNIIILLLKSPPHFLSLIPHTHPTTLFAFLTISLMCASSLTIPLRLTPLDFSFQGSSFSL